MRLKHDPFPVVFGKGDAPTRLWCLEAFGRAGTPQSSLALVELLGQQRSDGAFGSELDSEHWGTRETVRNALLMLRMGLPSQGLNVAAAARFVLEHQNGDGGWCENPSLTIPPFMRTFLSNTRSITWVTADAVRLLSRVGKGKLEPSQRAATWLRTTQNPQGGWPSVPDGDEDEGGARSDPDSTSQVAFLFRDLSGEQDPAYLKARVLYEGFVEETAHDAERGYRIRAADGSRAELDAYGLTCLLLSWLGDWPSRIESGYDVTDPRIRCMMEALISLQRDDGGWRPYWAEESSPVYTALALKALILTGMLEASDTGDLLSYPPAGRGALSPSRHWEADR